MNLKARLKKLERQTSQLTCEPFRVIVSHAGERLDLAKATCARTLWPNGQLMEVVNLHGSSDGLSEEDLEKFIQSHLLKAAYDQPKSCPSIGTAGKRDDT